MNNFRLISENPLQKCNESRTQTYRQQKQQIERETKKDQE